MEIIFYKDNFTYKEFNGFPKDFQSQSAYEYKYNCIIFKKIISFLVYLETLQRILLPILEGRNIFPDNLLKMGFMEVSGRYDVVFYEHNSDGDILLYSLHDNPEGRFITNINTVSINEVFNMVKMGLTVEILTTIIDDIKSKYPEYCF